MALCADELELHAECLVHGSRSTIGRNKRSMMLTRGCADKGVVDGAAGDAQVGDLGAEGKRRIFTEEPERREVVGQQAESIRGRAAQRARESRQDRVRLEPGVTGKPQTTALDDIDRCAVRFVVLDDQGDRDARVEKHDTGLNVRVGLHR